MRKLILTLLVGLLILPIRSFTLTPNEEVKGATFAGLVFDSAIDEDGDGFYDYLLIGLDVDLVRQGSYIIEGTLLHDESMTIVSKQPRWLWTNIGNFESITGPPGPLRVHMKFSGQDVLNAGLSGRFTVGLGLKVDGKRELVDHATYVTFRSYDFESFREVFVGPDEPMKDHGVDSDSDGKYDYLEANFRVRSLSSATYEVIGRLTAFDSTVVAIARDVLDLREKRESPDSMRADTSGVPSSALGSYEFGQGSWYSAVGKAIRFDGKMIRDSGLNGPYELEVTLLRSGKVISTKTFTTSDYSYTDFESDN